MPVPRCSGATGSTQTGPDAAPIPCLVRELNKRVVVSALIFPPLQGQARSCQGCRYLCRRKFEPLDFLPHARRQRCVNAIAFPPCLFLVEAADPPPPPPCRFQLLPLERERETGAGASTFPLPSAAERCLPSSNLARRETNKCYIRGASLKVSLPLASRVTPTPLGPAPRSPLSMDRRRRRRPRPPRRHHASLASTILSQRPTIHGWLVSRDLLS